MEMNQDQQKQYSWIECLVKPSLIKDYLITQEIQMQSATFQTYLDHLAQLYQQCNEEKQFTNKKHLRLMAVVNQINQIYTPILSDFSKENLQFELIQNYFASSVQNEYYQFLNAGYTLQYLITYVQHKELTKVRLQQMLKINVLEQRLTQSTEPIALLIIQLLIEFQLINEEYNIEHLFQIHDKLRIKFQQVLPPQYSTEKIEDFRYIILQIKDELSPVTDTDESKDELSIQENKQKGEGRSLIDPDSLIGNSSCRIMATYLQNGISTNNRELLHQLLKCVSGNDIIIEGIINYFLNNTPIDQIIRSIDITTIPDITILGIIAHLICRNSKGEKDTIKQLIFLCGKFSKIPNDTLPSIEEYLKDIHRNQITLPFKIDQYNQNIQIALCIILCHPDIRLLLNTLGQLIQQTPIENLMQFINNCLSKFMLEQLQSLLLKSIPEFNPIDFNNYYSLMPILTNEYPLFELELSLEVKIHLLVKAFRREKELIIYQFDSLKLEDQLQFKYSKLYKKQSLFYFKTKQYGKSIRKIIKYFEAYIYQPTFDSIQYVSENKILECLYQNFRFIEGQTANVLALISSQFISVSLEQTIFQNLSITEELSQFFFDGRMIERICYVNKDPQILKLMIKRIQDQDAFIVKSIPLIKQIQEKYLQKFLIYLSEQTIKF